MAEKKKSEETIENLIVSKACAKQDVYAVTKEVFEDLREVLADITRDLLEFISKSDKRIVVTLNSHGDFEAQMTLAGDTILFHMHTNVFTFPPSHMVHKSSYVSKDARNAYCGVINIYNFLTDSFRYQRLNDSGYLIGRIFVNREQHFFLEGKQQLGFLFNDFSNAELNKKVMREVLEEVIKHVLNFELYTPPYHSMSELRLSDIQDLGMNLKLQTAKRLGFRFQSDDETSVEF